MNTVETIELEGAGTRQSGGWGRRALVVTTVALFAASVAGLVTVAPKGKATPAQQLAKLQAFVNHAKTVHYVAESTTESKDGDNGLGSSYTDKSREEGDLGFPDRAHWVAQDGSTFDELIMLPTGTYDRSGDTRAEMLASQWVYSARGDNEGGWFGYAPGTSAAFDPGIAAGSSGGGALIGAMTALQSVGEQDLARLLRAASAPKQVAPDQIEVAIDVKTFLGAVLDRIPDPQILSHLPKITARLTTGPGDRLDRLVVTTHEDASASDGTGASTSTDDMRFSRWGEPVTIAKPTPDTVDPTPGIEEKDLAAFTVMPLLAPRTIPAGFELTSAEVVTSPQNASPADGNCAEVDLGYESPSEMAAFAQKARTATNPDNLTFPVGVRISLTPASCDYTEAGDGAKPIRLGRYSGTISHGKVSEGDDANTIEVVVGATRVSIHSDLPERQVTALASDLVPFDLATQPVHHEAPPQ